MATRYFTSILLISLLTGCRLPYHARNEMLKSELRWMEDQLYVMEDELDLACSELCHCRRALQQARASANQKHQSPTPVRQHSKLWPPRSREHQGPEELPAMDSAEVIQAPLPNEFDPQPPVIVDGPPVFDATPIEQEYVPSYPNDSSSEAQGIVNPDTVIHQGIDSPPTSIAPMPSSPDILPNPQSGSIDDASPANPGQFDFQSPTPNTQLPKQGSPPVLEKNGGQSGGDVDKLNFIQLQSHVSTEPIAHPHQAADSTQTQHENRSSRLDAHITHLVIDARRYEQSQLEGEHDLTVRVEPRNADGKYVELPGPISVVVLDRNQTGENARIARWDLTAAETADLLAIQEQQRHRGIVLDLDWPNLSPTSDGLHVFVRYTTVDGRRLQSHQRLGQQISHDDPSAWSVIEEHHPTGADQWQTRPMELSGASTIKRASGTFHESGDTAGPELGGSIPEPRQLPQRSFEIARPIN